MEITSDKNVNSMSTYLADLSANSTTPVHM